MKIGQLPLVVCVMADVHARHPVLGMTEGHRRFGDGRPPLILSHRLATFLSGEKKGGAGGI